MCVIDVSACLIRRKTTRTFFHIRLESACKILVDSDRLPKSRRNLYYSIMPLPSEPFKFLIRINEYQIMDKPAKVEHRFPE